MGYFVFLTLRYARSLRNLSTRHDLIAIVLSDHREKELPPIGFLTLTDLEMGEMILVNTHQKQFRKGLAESSLERVRQQGQFFRSAGIEYIEIATDVPYRDPILKFFRRREKTKWGRTYYT